MRSTDVLDRAGRIEARRGWMRQYLRSTVQDRLIELDDLVQVDLERLEDSEGNRPVP